MRNITPSKYWYLKQIKLFSDLSDEELKTMEAMTRMESVRKRQIVYIPGEPGNSVYILKEGRIKISRLMEDGRELTLVILEPGEIFEEIDALENTSRDTMASAMDDSNICVIRKEDFEKFLRTKPDIPIKLTKLIGLRLKRIENRIENLLYKDVPSRLAHILLDLSNEAGHIDNMGIRLKARLTHQELANLIASTRETVSLTLREFRDKGLIEFNRKEIIIRNKNGLIKYL
ncbi:MAG: Crp/Fnr family transcriptional regulator [Candidatus Schekmanbacteria bacterium]|nr:Crp/Fnr family transcriptional regulator [Candidatus Schekmanbacteria bacterium]